LARSDSTTGVAAQHQLGLAGAGAARATVGGRALGGSLGRGRGLARGRVSLARGGRWRRAAALERLPALAARALGRALAVRAGLARSAALAALGDAAAARAALAGCSRHQVLRPSSRQRTPEAVSSSTIPAAASRLADGVGLRPVLALAGRGARLDGDGHQRVDDRRQLTGAVVGPLVDRVERQHREHPADVGQRRRDRRRVALGQRGVARAHPAVHRGERLRHGEVVVERSGEGVPGGAARDGVRVQLPSSGRRVAHEGLDPLVGRGAVGHGLRRPLERRAVVGRAEHVAQHLRAGVRQHVLDRRGVAQALAHLLARAAAHGDQPVVQPVPRERVAGAGRLGDLVLVVREHQVEPAGVQVELLAEVVDRHRRALDVPARPAGSPRRRPGRLPGLGGLPEREVERVALGAGVPVRDGLLAGPQRVGVLAGQRAVVGTSRTDR
jgi:hypothetical protein